MNDDIIRMAREAGFSFETGQDLRDNIPALERFAALVAAHVTKTLTKSHEEAFQSYVDQAKADRELEALAARLAEREACAKVCEDLYKHLNHDADCRKLWPHTKMINDQYAEAIRARGEK